MDYYESAQKAAHYLAQQLGQQYNLAFVIGSGGESLLEDMEIQKRIPFSSVPHLIAATYLKGSGSAPKLEVDLSLSSMDVSIITKAILCKR